MITAGDILSSSGKFLNRAALASDDVRREADIIARKLTKLLTSFGKSRAVSSGYRDPASNKQAGGAKASAHLEGKAADIADVDGRLAIFCLRNVDLLDTLGLYMEDPTHTPGWVHLQTRPVSVRIFTP